MPTFFSPGGRTLAGGDMMPWRHTLAEGGSGEERKGVGPRLRETVRSQTFDWQDERFSLRTTPMRYIFRRCRPGETVSFRAFAGPCSNLVTAYCALLPSFCGVSLR